MPVRIIIILALIVSGCASSSSSDDLPVATTSYVNTKYSRRLTQLIDKIESGDLAAWNEYKISGEDTDGENAETFGVGCAEILIRDPTFYLRRHLAGDSQAIPLAIKGYRCCGSTGRDMIDQVYDRRIEIEANPNRRELISGFVSLSTTMQ
ncbi:hypothetical protein [Luteolibacter sp. AS25]|uniref:hypothetical protein n=1 Tax=Luteolibacter sp. AS25 TaxID=3135776 RepID=UPI00398BBBBC